MTNAEKDDQIHSLHLYIADRFTLLQNYASSLNDPENSEKMLVALKKISDTESEIQMAYRQIEDILSEPTEDDFADASEFASTADLFDI